MNVAFVVMAFVIRPDWEKHCGQAINIVMNRCRIAPPRSQ
jgi:hypothetical protein